MCCLFFFKQKTAYEMRISDWSSDVCSSDLEALAGGALHRLRHQREVEVRVAEVGARRVLAVPGARVVEQAAHFSSQRRLPVAGRIGEAGAVRHQQAQRDGRVRERGIAQREAEQFASVGIEVELARLRSEEHTS